MQRTLTYKHHRDTLEIQLQIRFASHVFPHAKSRRLHLPNSVHTIP